MAKDCLFCKIVDGTIPSCKVYEDKDYLAVLDIYPVARGQTLVMPKRHHDSYVFNLKDSELSDFIIAVKKVAGVLKDRLGAERINLVFEGTDINHLHAKLYPDYTCACLGKRASEEELKKIQKIITG